MIISVNNLKEILKDFKSKIVDKVTFEQTKTELSDKIDRIDTSVFMDKSTYDNDADGIVDKASVASKVEGIESSALFSVYGKSPNGEEGFYEFPIGYIDDQTNKFQSVRQNAKANEVYVIELIKQNKLNDLIIQAYEFTQGEQDVVTTLKEFNNSDSSNFYYDKDNIVFTSDGCKIKNEYEVTSTPSTTEEGLYELDFSKENFISDITNITVEVIE